MEFLEAMEKVKKMCKTYVRCLDCPLCEKPYESCRLKYVLDCDVRAAEKIISEWKPPVDWSKVKVDTPIWVWKHFNHKYKRYFAKYENGLVYVWTNGQTSWSAGGNEDIAFWDHAELAEEVENND